MSMMEILRWLASSTSIVHVHAKSARLARVIFFFNLLVLKKLQREIIFLLFDTQAFFRKSIITTSYYL
jgi:hypothetical protein